MSDDITQKPQQLGEVFNVPQATVLELRLAMSQIDAANVKLALIQRELKDATSEQQRLLGEIRSLASEGGKYALIGTPGGPPDSFALSIEGKVATCRRVRMPETLAAPPAASESAT